MQAPVGFWDPLGLSASGSTVVYERRHEVECKPDCVFMLATIGYSVPGTPDLLHRAAGLPLPAYGVKFADVPNGLRAVSKVPPSVGARLLHTLA